MIDFISGDYRQASGNARNSNSSCLVTDLSSFCQGQCRAPANCSSRTGQCQCPSSDYSVISDPLNNTLQTCECSGYPLNYWDGISCAVQPSTERLFSIIWNTSICSRSNELFPKLHFQIKDRTFNAPKYHRCK